MHETYFIAPGVGVVKKVGSTVTAWDGDGRMLWRMRPVYELTDVVGVDLD